MRKLSFKNWMKSVDRRVFNKIGLHLTDLPDEDFYTSFENGFTVEEMSDLVIKDISDCMTMLGIYDSSTEYIK